MRPPQGYAGAWFDGAGLSVALADDADADRVRALGAHPVSVSRSLAALEQAQRRYLDHVREYSDAGSVFSSHIDFAENRVVVAADRRARSAAEAAVQSAGLDPGSFHVIEGEGQLVFTANIKGATRTRNLTWEVEHEDHANICSVGASVVGGFLTAGHCGELNNVIANSAGTTMGSVDGSTFSYSDGYDDIDSAYVETVAGWTPTATIEGYTDADFTVPAKWSGIQEHPVNTTVCRYGSTSNPDCGTVEAVNVNYILYNLDRVTRVNNACSEDGDSGGPVVGASSKQLQGTLTAYIGGYDANGQPIPCAQLTTQKIIFQPVSDTIAEFGLTVLTAHGANAPTVGGFTCPDWDNSGGGFFYCSIDHYNAQGDEPTYLWSPSSGPGSTTMELFGTCTIGHPVSVTLATENQYGTGYRYANFTCPDDPP